MRQTGFKREMISSFNLPKIQGGGTADLRGPQIDPHRFTVPIDLPLPTSRVLIACNSCWKDIRNGSNAAIRSTWAQDLPAGWDLRFFVGGRNFTPEEEAQLFTPEWIGSPGTLGAMAPATAKKADIGKLSELCPDEISVDAPDGYLGLPWKTVESLKWALAEGYDFVFRIFTDTYVFPDRLLRSGFELNDAQGVALFGCPPCPAHPDSSHICPLGGDGYWTSRKGSQAIIDDPIKHWGEDTHAGFALANAGINLVFDPCQRYHIFRAPWENRNAVSIHLNERAKNWDPKIMIGTHAEQIEGRLHYPKWEGLCKGCGSRRMKIHPRCPRCAECGAFVDV